MILESPIHDGSDDQIEIFGMPYHGLLQGGMLTIPLASVTKVISMPQPSGHRPGDVLIAKVPGYTVTRTTQQAAADAAEGFKWYPYGVLRGPQSRIYGADLGKRSWLYCPGTPGETYRIEVGQGTGGPTSRAFSVKITRFGVFSDTPVNDTKTVVVGLPNDGAGGGIDPTGVIPVDRIPSYETELCDVSNSGKYAIIGMVQNQIQPFDDNFDRDRPPPYAFVKLTLSGSGSSAAITAAATVVANISQCATSTVVENATYAITTADAVSVSLIYSNHDQSPLTPTTDSTTGKPAWSTSSPNSYTQTTYYGTSADVGTEDAWGSYDRKMASNYPRYFNDSKGAINREGAKSGSYSKTRLDRTIWMYFNHAADAAEGTTTNLIARLERIDGSYDEYRLTLGPKSDRTANVSSTGATTTTGAPAYMISGKTVMRELGTTLSVVLDSAVLGTWEAYSKYAIGSSVSKQYSDGTFETVDGSLYNVARSTPVAKPTSMGNISPKYDSLRRPCSFDNDYIQIDGKYYAPTIMLCGSRYLPALIDHGNGGVGFGENGIGTSDNCKWLITNFSSTPMNVVGIWDVTGRKLGGGSFPSASKYSTYQPITKECSVLQSTPVVFT